MQDRASTTSGTYACSSTVSNRGQDRGRTSMNHAGESYGTPAGVSNGMPPEGEHERLQHHQQLQYLQQQQSYTGGAGGMRNGSSTGGPAMMNGSYDQQQHHINHPNTYQPVASTSAAISTAGPSKPSNKIRKRQKVEYDPVKRFLNDHPGTWDAIQVEEVVSHASSKRQKRTARDLGKAGDQHHACARE